jgi:putative ABC transport system permease protein
VAQVTLFSLAKKNVVGNFKSYLIYVISMIFSVLIYYTFVSLQYSKEIQKGIGSSDTMSTIFTEVSIILILFVAIFIWYSNAFFIKKRKKEVGLYALLGVRKKTIGSMLFYENLMMGAIALVTGIVLGTVLSKLFAMILLKLLDSAVEISFSISIEGIGNTVLVFAVIILFTSIQAYRLIYRFKLIELFHAEKEGENAPKASIVTAGIAVVLLVFSFWIAFDPITTFLINLGLFFLSLVIGTFLLFRSLTLFLLKIAQKNKTRYYRGMNLIGTSQLLYRIKGNARMLAMIALLSAATLSFISVGYNDYYNNQRDTIRDTPFSYMHISQGEAFDNQVKRIITDDQEHPITTQMDIHVIKTKATASDIDIVPPKDAGENPLRLISASTFNQIAKGLEREKTVQLSGDQAVVIKPLFTDMSSSDFKGHTLTIRSPQGESIVKFVDMLDVKIFNFSPPEFVNKIKDVVVSDTVFADIAKQVPPITYKVYKVKNQETTKATSQQLIQFNKEGVQMSTFYKSYRDGLESTGFGVFVLTFLGLVFLAATGSMIYFKQLTEAHSDKGRYEILRKIGVSKKEVLASIAKQTFFVFMLPLAVGILHSTILLKGLLGLNLSVPVLVSIIVYVVIFLLYYVLTVNSFNRIVNR